MKKPGVGFVLGKFMPPHQGHVYMCEFARQYCEKLVILVCSMPNEPIPGELRYKWMKEMFPDCIVIHETRELMQEPRGPFDIVFWNQWGEVIEEAMDKANVNTLTPTYVFASEEYGKRLAQEAGAKFIPVDTSRTARAVSGTAVRNDPYTNWKYLPHVVRPYFTKRVTLFGPESTGKSTLAASLGKVLDTIVVPEYGRTYTEMFGTELKQEQLLDIAHGHIASRKAAIRQANRVLIEDTDPVLTAVWSHMLFDDVHHWFDDYDDYADLYILTDIDIPWEDDGTRYFQDKRGTFMRACEAELNLRGLPYIMVSGSPAERLSKSIIAIEGMLNASISRL